MTKRSTKKHDPRRSIFISEILAGKPGSEAAKSAGFTGKHLAQTAYRLQMEPDIAAEIMGGTVQASLTALFGEPAAEVPLLYGGSVNPENAARFAEQRCIHGALVGGASLQANQFLQIIQATALAKA